MQKEEEAWKWHRDLAHTNMKLINNIAKESLMKGVPEMSFKKDKVYDACQKKK